jgi:uncharacterized protein
MEEDQVPGLNVEEGSAVPPAIEAVDTSTAGFVAVSGRGAVLGPLRSFRDFEQATSSDLGANLILAVRGFFENGGAQCVVSRIAADDPIETGLEFEGQIVSVVCCPDDSKIPGAAAAMAKHCEVRRDRICILQAEQPVVSVAELLPPVQSSYAVFYYPWLTLASLDGKSTVTIPPCGHIAGVYAETDASRGVWKAPANVVLKGVSGVSQDVTDAENDPLNGLGVNLIRNFIGRGVTVWGARTAASGVDPEWKYVNVRRLFIYIETSIYAGLQWVVFEPNNPILWTKVIRSIENFLSQIWRSGGLAGSTTKEAFYVKCDETTMTQDDLANGRLIVIVGIAPLRPAEFVIIRIGLWTQCDQPCSG